MALPEMIRLDRILFSGLIGVVMPLFCFVVFWWSSLLLTRENFHIMIAAFSGLGLGLILSFILLFVSKTDIYKLSMPTVIFIYIFYNVGLFGFFMGVPLFHPALGILAGYYWAKRLMYKPAKTEYKTEILRISKFTALIIGCVCLFSAVIAVLNPSTPSELKSMLHLPFEITFLNLIICITIGGLLLIALQYFLVKITMIKTLARNNIHIF